MRSLHCLNVMCFSLILVGRNQYNILRCRENPIFKSLTGSRCVIRTFSSIALCVRVSSCALELCRLTETVFGSQLSNELIYQRMIKTYMKIYEICIFALLIVYLWQRYSFVLCSVTCILLLIIRVCVYLRTRAPTRPRFKFRTLRLRHVVLGEKPTAHSLDAVEVSQRHGVLNSFTNFS